MVLSLLHKESAASMCLLEICQPYDTNNYTRLHKSSNLIVWHTYTLLVVLPVPWSDWVGWQCFELVFNRAFRVRDFFFGSFWLFSFERTGWMAFPWMQLYKGIPGTQFFPTMHSRPQEAAKKWSGHLSENVQVSRNHLMHQALASLINNFRSLGNTWLLWGGVVRLT